MTYAHFNTHSRSIHGAPNSASPQTISVGGNYFSAPKIEPRVRTHVCVCVSQLHVSVSMHHGYIVKWFLSTYTLRAKMHASLSLILCFY